VICGDNHDLFAFRPDLLDRSGEISGGRSRRFPDKKAFNWSAVLQVFSEFDEFDAIAHANHSMLGCPCVNPTVVQDLAATATAEDQQPATSLAQGVSARRQQARACLAAASFAAVCPLMTSRWVRAKSSRGSTSNCSAGAASRWSGLPVVW
jgi:hypothetical protein